MATAKKQSTTNPPKTVQAFPIVGVGASAGGLDKHMPGKFMPVATEHKEESLATKDSKAPKPEATQTDFRKSAESILLLKYTPAAVIVNEQLDIVHIHGVITPFLESPAGKPTFNLLKMAREGLAFELRNALHKAKTNTAPVIKDGIPTTNNGKQSLVTIQIVPLTHTVEPHYLILFENTLPVATELKGKGTTASQKINKDAQVRIKQVENELAQTREDMRSITEDQEAANEELQCANEELLSTSEEMQSLNEELETSKEELQSTNEELLIINQELVDKQEQLNASRFYSEAIIATMREPLVILDKSLRIKTANASFYKKFNVEEGETEGKLFYEIQHHQFDDTVLRSLLEKILPQQNRINDFEIKLHFPSIGERTLMLNARQIINEKTAEQLILLAMEDITERKVAFTELEEKNKRILEQAIALKKEFHLLQNYFMEAPAFFVILKGKDHVFEFANTMYHQLVGNRDIVGKKMMEALPELKGQGFDVLVDEIHRTGTPFSGSEMPAFIEQEKGKLKHIYIDLHCQPIKNEEGYIDGILIFGYDVTEQVTVRKLIEASEKRFSNILSQSLLAIAILKGREMVVTSANDVIINIWGKGKNVIGKRLSEVLPELIDQPFPKLLDDVYTTGIPFATPEIKALLNRNGKMEECYFNLIYQPYTDVDNTVTGVTILATEITDYVCAKKQIEASDVFNRNILNSSPDCLKILDIEGRIQYMNFNGICQMEIDDFSKVKSKYWWDIWGADNEDLLKVAVDKALAGETAEFSAFCATAKGTPKWWDVLVSPVATTGEGVQQIIAVSRDVTERKTAEKLLQESEIKFRTLSETIPNMIWTATPDGKKNFFNKYYLDYTGLTSEELQDKGMINIIYPDDLERDLQLWQHSLKTGEDFNIEKRIRHHDGTYRWHVSHGIAQKDIQGNITGWIGSNTEIHEQKLFTEQLETKVKERTFELQTTNKELKQTNAQLDQFAHVASHDLQEPLRKIITFSKLLQEKHTGSLPAEAKTYLTKIEGASSRMTTLIKDLLNYSRLPQHEILFTQVNLNETLQHILIDFELSITEKNAVIKTDILPTIKAIPLQMNQLFYNLISNALKFTKKTVAPVITITSRTLTTEEVKKYPTFSPSATYFEIIFKDNGIGFNQQYDKQIFTIFQRLHDNTTYHGTGIGLALCKKIVENHHGEIFVKAKENNGAAFHILLPAN